MTDMFVPPPKRHEQGRGNTVCVDMYNIHAYMGSH